MIDFIEYYVNATYISELLIEFYDLDLYTFFPPNVYQQIHIV